MSYSISSDSTAVVHFCNATSDITGIPYSHQQSRALSDLLELLVSRLSAAQFEALRDPIQAARDRIQIWSNLGMLSELQARIRRQLEARNA